MVDILWMGMDFVGLSSQPDEGGPFEESHRVAGARDAIEAKGAFLKPLPPYSPDLNPIERVFQDQGPAPQSREADHRGPLCSHRLGA